MASLPSTLTRSTSFTSFQTSNPSSPPPGTALDANYDLALNAINQVATFLRVSVNADGSLNTTAVQTAYGAGSGNNPPADGDDAQSLLNAQLAQAWAEHMPDELPADTLAEYGITGQHWSSRWWANQATLAVETLGGEFGVIQTEFAIVQAEISAVQDTAGGANNFALEALAIATAAQAAAQQANNAAQAAVQSVQALELQIAMFNTLFQNEFITWLQAFAGSLPTSPSVNGGEFWSNGGEVAFNPFSSLASAFPTTPPTPGSHILWSNGGVLSVA